MSAANILRVSGVAFVFSLVATTTQAAIITTDTATASSNFAPRPGARASDNSGITGSGSLSTNGDFVHNSTSSNMWLTDAAEISGDALGETLTINLSVLYNIDGMRIWNYNEADGGDSGISIYDLETSPNGTTWTLQQDNASLAQAPGAAGYAGVYSPVSWSNVKFVRFTIVDTYRAIDDHAGLSEVMLSGTAVTIPEPTSAFLLGISSVGLVLLRRRKMRRVA